MKTEEIRPKHPFAQLRHATPALNQTGPFLLNTPSSQISMRSRSAKNHCMDDYQSKQLGKFSFASLNSILYAVHAVHAP